MLKIVRQYYTIPTQSAAPNMDVRIVDLLKNDYLENDISGVLCSEKTIETVHMTGRVFGYSLHEGRNYNKRAKLLIVYRVYYVRQT